MSWFDNDNFPLFCSCGSSCCSSVCSGWCADNKITPALADSLIYLVNQCASQCGASSLCSGLLNTTTIYNCSCQSGYISATNNGKNCQAACSNNATCGANAYCASSNSLCSCFPGSVAPLNDGKNCYPISSKMITEMRDLFLNRQLVGVQLQSMDPAMVARHL